MLGSLVSHARQLQSARDLLMVGCIILFSVTAFSTCCDYFFKWAHNESTYLAFSGPEKELAALINSNADPDSVYVLPCDAQGETSYDASYECNHFPLSFFYTTGGARTPLESVFMYEPTVPDRLSQISEGKDQVHLIALKQGKRKFLYPEADPRNLLQFFLEGLGELINVESSPYYDIMTYRFGSKGQSFGIPAQFRSYGNRFEGQLLLREGVYGGVSENGLSASNTIESGQKVWAVLKWDVLGDVGDNFRSSLRLVDNGKHVVHQIDHILFDSRRQGTSRWSPADMPFSDFYLFSIPPSTPPGIYDLQIGLYSPGLDHLLSIDDNVGQRLLSLGKIKVAPPSELPDNWDIEAVNRLDAPIIPEITIFGHDLDTSRSYSPGERVSLPVYWQVNESPTQDLLWNMALQNEEGAWPVMQPVSPLGAEWPTSRWAPGMVWRAVYDFSIPPNVPQGDYDLIGFFTSENGRNVGQTITLGAIELAGRAREFRIPEFAYPVQADFGEKIRLLGYDLAAASVDRGADFEVVLHWQALAQTDVSYTIFVHLLDATGQVKAQMDALPGGGAMSTTGWLPGEVISDRIVIPLRTGMAPGRYTLSAGMYDASSGERLAILDSASSPIGDHLILQNIEVN